MENLERVAEDYVVPEIDPTTPNEIFQETGVVGTFAVPVDLGGIEYQLTYAQYHRNGCIFNGLVVPYHAMKFLPDPGAHLRRLDKNNRAYLFYGLEIDDIPLAIDRFVRRPHAVSQSELSLQWSREYTRTTVEEVAGRIHRTPPERVLLYSGAGLSADDRNGVMTYTTYQQRLGLSEGRDGMDKVFNRFFAERFLSNEGHVAEMLQWLGSIACNIEQARPTEAHYAFTEIVRALGSKPLTATTNIDWLHQQTGLDVPYITAGQDKFPKSFLPRHFGFDKVLRKRMETIELALVFGRSSEPRGLLTAIRSCNPNLLCVAFNTKAQNLPYLQPGDLVVEGPCAETVPGLRDAIKNSA